MAGLDGPVDEGSFTRRKVRISAARSLLIARFFLFFGQFVDPNIVAQTQLVLKRFGFADADLAALVQELLNKCIIRGFFWDMFHKDEHKLYSSSRQYQLCGLSMGNRADHDYGSGSWYSCGGYRNFRRTKWITMLDWMYRLGALGDSVRAA